LLVKLRAERMPVIYGIHPNEPFRGMELTGRNGTPWSAGARRVRIGRVGGAAGSAGNYRRTGS